MYGKLKIYYFYIPLPFVMLLVGALFFRQAIVNTLTNNPHPQINYAIFVLILIGAVLVLRNMFKIMSEAKVLSRFSEALRSGAPPARLQQLAMACEADIAYVLRMIAASAGRPLSHREQATLEKELVKADIRLNNRHTLPQHITNLLVGMGLLGTFIGLLATLGDIAALISTFSTLDISTANPIEVFRTLVDRMKAPMYSMGIAFSASLYGLLGSIILGFMMVSTRRCMQDVVSLLGSEVAQHIEFALVHELTAKGEAGESLPLVPGVPVGGLAGTMLTQQWCREQIGVLRRIEERLGESTRLQESALQTEIAEYSKQRGEFLRAHADLLAELHEKLAALVQAANTQARQAAVAGDLMTGMAADTAETRQLIAQLLDRAAANEAQAAELARALHTGFQQAVQQLAPQPAGG